MAVSISTLRLSPPPLPRMSKNGLMVLHRAVGAAVIGKEHWLGSNSCTALLPLCCVTLVASLPCLSLGKKGIRRTSCPQSSLLSPSVFVILTS